MVADMIALLVIMILVVAAVVYIRKEKKRGAKCIGCPYAGECAKKSGCGGHTDTKQNIR